MKVVAILDILPQLVRRLALVHEITLVVELVRAEETVLAVECLAMEDPTIIAYIVIILVEHIAGSHAINAFLPLLNRQSLMQILAKYEHFIVLSHLLQAVSVELCSLGEVPGLNGLILKSI